VVGPALGFNDIVGAVVVVVTNLVNDRGAIVDGGDVKTAGAGVAIEGKDVGAVKGGELLLLLLLLQSPQEAGHNAMAAPPSKHSNDVN